MRATTKAITEELRAALLALPDAALVEVAHAIGYGYFSTVSSLQDAARVRAAIQSAETRWFLQFDTHVPVSRLDPRWPHDAGGSLGRLRSLTNLLTHPTHVQEVVDRLMDRHRSSEELRARQQAARIAEAQKREARRLQPARSSTSLRGRALNGEVVKIAGHAVRFLRDQGRFRCDDCLIVWKYLPYSSRACEGVPFYPWRSAPDDLKTERQHRRELHMAPGGQPAGYITLPTGGRKYLYHVADATPLKRRRIRCSTCDVLFAPVVSERTCGDCLKKRAERKQRSAERITARAAARAAAPPSVAALLGVLDDLWMLNQGVRNERGRERACWYTLKDAVIAAFWVKREDEPRPIGERISEWIAHWNEPTDLQVALPTSGATEPIMLTLAHTTGPSRTYGERRSYLALVFTYGPVVYPFHAPWENAESWLDAVIWKQLTPRPWTENSDGEVIGGRPLDQRIHWKEDWPGRINRLIAFTGKKRNEVFFDPYADHYDELRRERAAGQGYSGSHWDDEEDDAEEWDEAEW